MTNIIFCLQFHKDVSNYYNKQFLLLSCSPFVTKIQGFWLVKSSQCWLLLDRKNTLAIIHVTTQGHSVSFTPWSLTQATATRPERPNGPWGHVTHPVCQLHPPWVSTNEKSMRRRRRRILRIIMLRKTTNLLWLHRVCQGDVPQGPLGSPPK